MGQGGSGGFVQLTGEVGTGKTTMCRCLLEQLPEDTHVALVLNPLLTPRELLATICEELGIDTNGIADSSKAMVDALNAYLLAQHAQGHRVVVVIDEAQNLSPEALEQVRLLTNLETPKEKLLQMVLLGQPELRPLLQRQNLRQLAQRITARYHLEPLNQEETAAYVRHRMKVAGAQRNPFTRSALRALYQRSCGVPRLLNIIADRALAGAYAGESGRVNARLVHAAASEVQPSEHRVRSNPWRGLAATAAALLLVVITLMTFGPAWLDRFDYAPSPDVAADEPAATGSTSAVGPLGDPATEQPEAAPFPAQGAVTDVTETIASDPGPALDENWLGDQHRGAWRALAELWQSPGEALAIQSACDGVPATGFACLQDSGSWARIRELGLPVLLVLRDGGTRLLPLTGFSGQDVVVGAPAAQRVVARSEIEETWWGDYLVAWPQAPDWPLDIRRGESGPAVDIVMQMASFATPPWDGAGAFDAAFEAWLLDFQRRRGLAPDGIIGPNTLLYLMAPTITEPRLALDNEEEG